MKGILFWFTHLHQWTDLGKADIVNEDNNIIGVRFFQQCSDLSCRKYRRTSFI